MIHRQLVQGKRLLRETSSKVSWRLLSLATGQLHRLWASFSLWHSVSFLHFIVCTHSTVSLLNTLSIIKTNTSIIF